MSVKKGDPVRVRLCTGEVVDAVYNRPSYMLRKCHRVDIGGASYLAVGGVWRSPSYILTNECHFVVPTPIINLNSRGE